MGVHAANMGSTWLGLIYGFAGLGMENRSFNLSPELPEAWSRLRFRIWFHGRQIEMTITQTEIMVKLLSGDSLQFYLKHKPFTLTKNHLVKEFIK